MVYATVEYYLSEHGGTVLSDPKDIEKALKTASRHIDALTFGRTAKGLTEYQAEILRDVACRLVDFEAENADILQSALSGYSINGVSVNLSGTMRRQNGVMIPEELYGELSNTGLTCLLI